MSAFRLAECYRINDGVQLVQGHDKKLLFSRG